MNRTTQFISKNPYTLQVLKEFQYVSATEYNTILDRSKSAYRAHSKLSYAERAAKFMKLADVLEARQDECAKTITQEMGKPANISGGEAVKAAQYCRYYAENGEQFLKDEIIETTAKKSYVHYEPIGPIFAVMPWNFPLWLPMKAGVPAIMSGNSFILKPAPNVAQTALLLQDIFEEAGFTAGEFQTAILSNEQIGDAIADPRVAGVTFTGSGPTGSIIAGKAGAALKKVVLELGGSDPLIVLDDAPVEEVARRAVLGRCSNSGQICISPKRMIVDKSVMDRFQAAAIKTLDEINFGDPLDGATNFGPLAREDILDKLTKQINDAEQEGAKIVYQKKHENAKGLYYPPTIVSNVQTDSQLFKDEVFGPVIVLIPADNEEHAIDIANDSVFGLGGSVWTADTKKGESIAQRIDVGAMFVNELEKIDVRVPFGGTKASGFGRECGEHGIREFTNAKSIWVEK